MHSHSTFLEGSVWLNQGWMRAKAAAPALRGKTVHLVLYPCFGPNGACIVGFLASIVIMSLHTYIPLAAGAVRRLCAHHATCCLQDASVIFRVIAFKPPSLTQHARSASIQALVLPQQPSTPHSDPGCPLPHPPPLHTPSTPQVILPLYPQFSISTSGSSLRLIEALFKGDPAFANLQHTVIPSWYQRPGYVRAMADLIERELDLFPDPQEVRGREAGEGLARRGMVGGCVWRLMAVVWGPWQGKVLCLRRWQEGVVWKWDLSQGGDGGWVSAS